MFSYIDHFLLQLQTRRITRSRPNAATNQTVNNENKVTVAANARTVLKKNASKGSVGEKEPLKATKNPLQAVQLKRQALDDKTKVGAANSHVVVCLRLKETGLEYHD